MEERRIVSGDREVMGDKLVFTGTCIEVETLVDYLKAGHAPEGFPTVSREQAEAYLETTIS